MAEHWYVLSRNRYSKRLVTMASEYSKEAAQREAKRLKSEGIVGPGTDYSSRLLITQGQSDRATF